MTRTWFITGTSTGIGRILTETLLARGDRVVATLRTASALDELKAAAGERLHVVTLDVGRTDTIRGVVDDPIASMRSTTPASMRHIAVLGSNAGYGLFGAAEELTSEQIRQQIDTNLIGSIEVIRAALPHLRAQGGGRILQISSEGGQIAYPGFSVYHATKWGIEGFCESVSQEVARFGIEFTLVEPGPARSDARSPPARSPYAATPPRWSRR